MESVYHRILTYESRKSGFKAKSEYPIPLEWDDHTIEKCFRADLIVDDLVLVELKSLEEVPKLHLKQILTYLKLANLELGLLINFGSPPLKDGVHRVVNGLK